MTDQTLADGAHCPLGPCAAPAGHDGTCAEASGFEDWAPEVWPPADLYLKRLLAIHEHWQLGCIEVLLESARQAHDCFVQAHGLLREENDRLRAELAELRGNRHDSIANAEATVLAEAESRIRAAKPGPNAWLRWQSGRDRAARIVRDMRREKGFVR